MTNTDDPDLILEVSSVDAGAGRNGVIELRRNISCDVCHKLDVGLLVDNSDEEYSACCLCVGCMESLAKRLRESSGSGDSK
jgi:hypothetical protein